jgi:signal transduction histidine kinase/CheY-like chemotaxis protein
VYPHPPSAQRTVALIGAALLVLLAAVRAVDLWRDRQADLGAAERRAANHALILAEYLRGAFQAADTSLRHLSLHARRAGGVGSPSAAWDEVLSSARAALPGVGSLSVVDTQGVIRHSTVPITGQSRRSDYVFQELARDPRDRLVASTPFRSLLNPKQVMIPLARPITAADGRFEGLVVATFLPAEVRGLFEQLDVGREGAVWVFHPDGVVLFHIPSPQPMGEAAAGNPLFEASRHQAGAGTRRGPLQAGGPELVSAFYSLSEPPLTVAVSLGQREVLAGWRRELAATALVGGLLAALTIALLALVTRRIGERAAADQARQRSQRLESIGKLTGGVAHDFNNLLTVILGNLDLLRQPGALSSAAGGRRLAEIEHAAGRAAQLTRELLTFARRQHLHPQVVDVNELTRNVQPLLARLLGEDVSLRMNLSAAPCLASLDPAQAEAALVNLCVNARDAMPQGGLVAVDTAVVTLDEAYARRNPDVAPGEYVMVAVTDTGVGIPPENMPRLFEPFFTTKAPGKGTGLGLSSVYGFVKQSGGHVQVYSELAQGTGVKMYFPRAAGEAAPAPAPGPAPERGTGQTILLVEDEPTLRGMAAEMLEALGYRVVSAADGPAALAKARGLPRIDLLLTDVMLPNGMTGRQVAEELTRLRPGLNVLYASGYSEDVIMHRGRLDPGLRLLGKPYNMDDLARAVRDAMRAD